jgi:hypothetical protein
MKSKTLILQPKLHNQKETNYLTARERPSEDVQLLELR